MKCLMPAAAFMLVMGAAAAEMLLRFSDGSCFFAAGRACEASRGFVKEIVRICA